MRAPFESQVEMDLEPFYPQTELAQLLWRRCCYLRYALSCHHDDDVDRHGNEILNASCPGRIHRAFCGHSFGGPQTCFSCVERFDHVVFESLDDGHGFGFENDLGNPYFLVVEENCYLFLLLYV